ncbi:MAG: hypothetical protein HY400_02285 [Elusimicrobia bacterium]|nr:hypothetical protein [Elusimicrobiota bacterium]
MIKKEEGQALPLAILLMMVLAILIPTMVWWVQQDTISSVKQKKSTTAFHLAEAAIDRARWKLQETGANWASTASGVLSNYNFDKTFTDVPGGTYVIKISSDATNKNRRIAEGVGRDSSTNEVRRIRAVFEQQTFDSAIWSGGDIDVNGASSRVHWGPIRAQKKIEMAAGVRFPRLYSKDKITPDPPYCGSPTCTNKTDNIQFWAYFDVPPRPEIKLGDLKTIAQSSGTYFTTSQDWGNAYPGGSCTGCPPWLNAGTTWFAQNAIWYFDLDPTEELKLTGSKFIYGTVIITGKLTLQGGGNSSYMIIPPPDAWREYKIVDTVAADEWYGDMGGAIPSPVSPTFEFGKTPCPAYQADNCINDKVSFRGFVYAQNEFDASGGDLVHGMIIVDKDEVSNSGNILVFYDPGAINNVPVGFASVTLVEWDEVPGVWP